MLKQDQEHNAKEKSVSTGIDFYKPYILLELGATSHPKRHQSRDQSRRDINLAGRTGEVVDNGDHGLAFFNKECRPHGVTGSVAGALKLRKYSSYSWVEDGAGQTAALSPD